MEITWVNVMIASRLPQHLPMSVISARWVCGLIS